MSETPRETPLDRDPRYWTLIDFLGWATSRDEELHLSSHHNASPAIDALKAYLAERPTALSREPETWETAIQEVLLAVVEGGLEWRNEDGFIRWGRIEGTLKAKVRAALRTPVVVEEEREHLAMMVEERLLPLESDYAEYLKEGHADWPRALVLQKKIAGWRTIASILRTPASRVAEIEK